MAERSTQNWLGEIWSVLTQGGQLVLSEVRKLQPRPEP